MPDLPAEIELFGGPCDGQTSNPSSHLLGKGEKKGIIRGIGNGQSAIYMWDEKRGKMVWKETLDTDDIEKIIAHMDKHYLE